ncbi:MAG TPA: HK97 gp10 family phage protein [Candidatus Enterenecus merdae]|nr:HK97 gp10 family phage protein [Candidatus Enterenecus merdae]
MTLDERVRLAKKQQTQVQAKLRQAAQGATLRAIEKAVALTPPTMNDLSGANTRTGELKQRWVTDSKFKPQKRGAMYVTELNNNRPYASYVNDGHRMDKHFVPGLHVNPGSGQLEYTPGADVGIVVGTKTAYVKGKYMVEAAKEEYRRVLKQELEGLEELIE